MKDVVKLGLKYLLLCLLSVASVSRLVDATNAWNQFADSLAEDRWKKNPLVVDSDEEE